jgi:hypothetical protein
MTETVVEVAAKELEHFTFSNFRVVDIGRGWKVGKQRLGELLTGGFSHGVMEKMEE